MKKLSSLFALLVALLAPGIVQNTAAAPASAPAVPEIIVRGFEGYKTNNALAIDTWFKGSPIEKDVKARVNVTETLNNFEKVFGKYLGWELVKVVPITASTEIVYAVAKFEKGPLWFAFNCYKATDAWTLPSIRVNQNPEAFLPAAVMAGQ